MKFINLLGLILFTQSLLRAASDQIPFKPNNHRDLDPSNRLTQALWKVQSVDQTFTGELGKPVDVTRYEKDGNLAYSMKAKGGKGAVGGGSTVAHRPGDSRSTATGAAKPALFAAIMFACLTLLPLVGPLTESFKF